MTRSAGAYPYVRFVILLTPAPFSADTKNTLIPDFLTPENPKFMIFTPKHNNSHFFDTSLKILTPALPVVPVTNIRYAMEFLFSETVEHCTYNTHKGRLLCIHPKSESPGSPDSTNYF